MSPEIEALKEVVERGTATLHDLAAKCRRIDNDLFCAVECIHMALASLRVVPGPSAPPAERIHYAALVALVAHRALGYLIAGVDGSVHDRRLWDAALGELSEVRAQLERLDRGAAR